MKIKQIGYGRGTYFPDSQGTNEYLYAQAELDDGEDSEVVLNLLKEWVAGGIGVETRLSELNSEIRRLEIEKESLEQSNKSAQERWEKIKAFYEQIKVPLENPDYDPIPF